MHPDLKYNYNARASYDFSSNDPYPYPRYTDDWFNRFSVLFSPPHLFSVPSLPTLPQAAFMSRDEPVSGN
uniref:Uncharacterized protein n=1 Tax=Timema shepardi TaxID=629360 RepID=A0A7R9FVC9_TIMSH|nr:unnamed protein product [Timema shepardi]